MAMDLYMSIYVNSSIRKVEMYQSITESIIVVFRSFEFENNIGDSGSV
jgi:hypothetical protein